MCVIYGHVKFRAASSGLSLFISNRPKHREHFLLPPLLIFHFARIYLKKFYIFSENCKKINSWSLVLFPPQILRNRDVVFTDFRRLKLTLWGGVEWHGVHTVFCEGTH
jgi:hypothetical protein